MNSRTGKVAGAGVLVLLVGAASLLAGCASKPCCSDKLVPYTDRERGLLADPFKDELADAPPVTTPSMEGVLAAKITRVPPRRDFQPTSALPLEGTVTHAPLFFEDPSEVTGSEDGKFAWTGEDYLFFFTWRARFLANIVLFPINFIDTPIWTVMESDGNLAPRGPFDEQHDAARAYQAVAVKDAPPSPCGDSPAAAH